MSPTVLAWTVALGVAFGGGSALIVAAAPPLARPSLAARIAPQLVDLSAEARTVVVRRRRSEGTAVRSLWARGRAAIDGWIGGHERVRALLRRAGSGVDIDGYRSQQLFALLGGAAFGAIAGAALVASASISAIAAVILPVAGAAGGVVLRERMLGLSATKRTARIAHELPTMLAFLALSLAAGEGIHDALRRLARVGRGELSREIASVMNEVASGVPLATALGQLSRELTVPALTRAVDQLVSALDRGAPLADVLRAQAQDCREEAKRGLLESAGRKEIAMLVPLVFLILPFTVLVAVFPGLVVLQAGL